jgi:transketolase
VFDCDLATSVKTDGFAATCPNAFFQGGIQEHNTAVIAGALSTQGVVTFWADFGVFGIDEAYNQHRLNDINHTHLKLVTTHDGLDVGEDGKTHQCIDYVGVLRNLYGFRVIVPADPNQTDRVVRYIATQTGNFALAMGRSPIPVILDLEGKPLFGGDYRFEYGKADLVRPGTRAAIVTMGSMVYRAVAAWEKLKAMGIDVAVWNFSCPIDLDGEALERAAETGLLVTYEDHNVRTGLGCSVANALAEKGLGARLVKLGIPHYGASGKPDDLFKLHGLSVDHLIEAVRSHLA